MAVGSYLNQGYNKYAAVASTDALNAVYGETIDAIYKKFYLPAVRDLLNNKKILSRYIRTNTEDVAGEEAILSVNTGRNEGIGHIDEQGRLPDPMKQQYNTLKYRMRYYYGRILFSGPSQAASRNDRGAFIRVMDGEIKGLARDMQVDANRIWFGDGTGRLARISAVAGANTVFTLEKPGGFDQNLGMGTQYIRDGMRVAVVRTDSFSVEEANYWQAAGSTRAYYVINTNYASGTISLATTYGGAAATLNAPAMVPGAAENWYLVRASESGNTAIGEQDTAFMNEPFGLAALVDDGNPPTGNAYGAAGSYNLVGGLDASTNSIWRAAVVDNGGIPVPFAQDLLQQGMDLVDQLGDGNVELWMTTHGIRRQYVNTLVANKRYVGTMEMDGGFKAVTYDERPIVVDKDCTRGRIYGLDLNTLMFFMENDYQWMDGDGSILQRLLDKDAYQATLYRYHNFGTDARNRNVLIADIIDS